MINQNQYILADWPAPKNVKAITTTRQGGGSVGQYQAFNLAYHVSDNQKSVNKNRQLLQQDLGLIKSPCWLEQVHGTLCTPWEARDQICQADACFATQKQQPCVVMTADCLPILLSNRQGTWVAACHAGWRGLADGVIQNTIGQYSKQPSDLIAWIGPAISQTHFEVGDEVKALFTQLDAGYQKCFEINSNGRYQFDFFSVASQILTAYGIECYGGNWCSYTYTEKFYSFRRDGKTGRMASLIWLE